MLSRATWSATALCAADCHGSSSEAFFAYGTIEGGSSSPSLITVRYLPRSAASTSVSVTSFSASAARSSSW